MTLLRAFLASLVFYDMLATADFFRQIFPCIVGGEISPVFIGNQLIFPVISNAKSVGKHGLFEKRRLELFFLPGANLIVSFV